MPRRATLWAVRALGDVKVTEKKHREPADAYAEVVGHKAYFWTDATAKPVVKKDWEDPEKRAALIRSSEGWEGIGWAPKANDS